MELIATAAAAPAAAAAAAADVVVVVVIHCVRFLSRRRLFKRLIPTIIVVGKS
jgi:hypothetical protein